ncbi:fibronectin type III domain-containing protein [Patescibacteria group bacterium]|nr:fibronectin type III domain-containing protein [Patescibacteria group bacterium]
MLYIIKKPKRLLTALAIVAALTMSLVGIQSAVTNVTAALHPIMFVSPETGLEFGLSFPQEERTAEFIVVGKNWHETIYYGITLERKPLPDGYEGNGEDPDKPGYYRNLCPYLEAVNEDIPVEPDTMQMASVDPRGLGPDNLDYWLLKFDVPTIEGFVDQGFIGTPVDGPGEFGCDLNIQFIHPCIEDENIVVNGSFEQPSVESDTGWDIFDPSVVNGWDADWVQIEPPYGGEDQPLEAYIELHNGIDDWVPAPNGGEQYAELDSDWNGHVGTLSGEPASSKIYQDIYTNPGYEYKIKFNFSPRPDTLLADNSLEFSWDGILKDTINRAGSSNTDWSAHEYTFTATDWITRLQFADAGTSNSNGTFVDNVSVTCIPIGQCTPGQQSFCDTDLPGSCSDGTKLCDQNGNWGNCEPESGNQEYCTNGVDDDCDGLTDGEDPDCRECEDEEIQRCDTGNLGICSEGTQTCDEGLWGACEQHQYPTEEVCENSQDDDCDGLPDRQDTDCQTCQEGEDQPCETGQLGVCAQGTQYCDLGDWGICVPDQYSTEESCNGLDDDCDGETDEGDVCDEPPVEECGNNIYEPNNNEECDNGEGNRDNMDPVYDPIESQGDRWYCSTQCSLYFVAGTWCGDGIQQAQHEECDGTDGVTEGYTCTSECLLEVVGPECSDLDGDGYSPEGEECGDVDCDDAEYDVNPGVGEDCDDGIDNDCDGFTDGDDSDCEVPNGPYCGDNSCNGGETCESCSNDCGSCPPPPGGGGGGGGGSALPLYIHHVSLAVGSTPGSVDISWFTNRNSDSRVVFDTASHPDPTDPPNYGYSFSTGTFDSSPKVTYHIVTVTGLLPGTPYYFRPVSAASPAVYGEEFTIFLGEEPPVEEPPVEEPPTTPPPTPPAPTPGPGPTPGPESILGCMDEEALNYNSEATEDDGNCEYEGQVLGEALDEDGGEPVVLENLLAEEDETAEDTQISFLWWLLLLILLIIIWFLWRRRKKKDEN